MNKAHDLKSEHRFTFCVSEIKEGKESYLVYVEFYSFPDPFSVWKTINSPLILEELRSWCGQYMDFVFNESKYSLADLEELVQKIQNQIFDARITKHTENCVLRRNENSKIPLTYKIIIKDETDSTYLLESFYGDPERS
ncbi:hypothetical protein EBU91_00440 [bacterium]|nr:hypothetical protein [bacterium]